MRPHALSPKSESPGLSRAAEQGSPVPQPQTEERHDVADEVYARRDDKTDAKPGAPQSRRSDCSPVAERKRIGNSHATEPYRRPPTLVVIADLRQIGAEKPPRASRGPTSIFPEVEPSDQSVIHITHESDLLELF